MKFSKKQKEVLDFWKTPPYNGVICDGAVRSGKTLAAVISFINWTFAVPYYEFAICGKSVSAILRNCFAKDITNILTEQGYTIRYDRENCKVYITGTQNNMIETKTYMLISGRSEDNKEWLHSYFYGVLFDDVTLISKAIVEAVLARCVSESKQWFVSIPEHPYHWFFEKFICQTDEKNLLYVHFIMEDNPSLTPFLIKRYKSLYSGVFYTRLVLGQWVMASGLVYPTFNADTHIVDNIENLPFTNIVLTCNYGTVNPFSCGLWGLYRGVWYRINEFVWNPRDKGYMLTDEEYYTHVKAMCEKYRVNKFVIDPSAASFIQTVKKKNEYDVFKPIGNIQEDIENVAKMLCTGELMFSEECQNILNEFYLYRWDENNHKKEVPLNVYNRSMDDMRYLIEYINNRT